MANFPIQYTKQTVSGRGPGARAGIDVTTGGQAMARAISGVGEAVAGLGVMKREIEKRKATANDLLASEAVSQAWEVEKTSFEVFIKKNPDPALWEQEASAVVERMRELFNKKAFSPDTHQIELQKEENAETVFTTRAEIITIDQMADDAITATGAGLTTAIESGDDSPESKAKVQEKMKAHHAALINKFSPEVAATRMREAVKDGIKKYWTNQAKIYPEKTIETMMGKLKSLKEGRKPDTLGLDAKDYTDIISQANAQINYENTKGGEEQEETAIRYSGLVAQVKTTGGAISLMAEIDKDIANGSLDRRVGEGYKKELISGVEVPTNWNVYNKLALDIEAVRDGEKDFLEVFNEIQTHRGANLNGSEIDSLTASVITAKSIAKKELPAVTTNILTRFQRILTAYYNAGMWGDIDDEDEMPEATAKYANKAAQLDIFFKEKTPTVKEAEEFFGQLTEDAGKDGILKKIWKLAFSPSPLYLMWKKRQEAKEEKLKSLGDQNRLKFDTRNIGDMETIKGENWILIERGNTPAEDIWQKQQ